MDGIVFHSSHIWPGRETLRETGILSAPRLIPLFTEDKISYIIQVVKLPLLACLCYQLHTVRSRCADKVACRLHIARAVAPSHDVHVIKRKVRATSRSAQDVVVLGRLLGIANDVLHRNISDDHPVCREAGWAAVEVILLDVNPVVANVVDDDVFVGDAT